MEIYHDFFKSNMLHDKLLWESTNLHSEKLLKNQLFEKKITPPWKRSISESNRRHKDIFKWGKALSTLRWIGIYTVG